MFEAVEAAFESSMLTDANDAEDAEVKTRLAALGESVATLEGFVDSCHQATDETHEGH